MNNQIIIFEEISPIHKWIIRWYLFKKKEVYFSRLNRFCRSKGWIKDYINKGYIKKINFDFKLNTFEGMYYDLAFDNVDGFFQIVKESRIIKRIKKLYDNDNIKLVFKKVLHEKLARFYYLNYILNKIQDKYLDKKITFIPSNGIELYRTDGCEIYDYFKFYKLAKKAGVDVFDTNTMKFSIWAVVNTYVYNIKRKLSTFIKILGFLFYICVYKIVNLFKKTYILKNYYKYVIMIISPLRQFANRIQRIDFLLDDDLIKRDEAVFISYKRLDKRYRKYLEDNKLNYLDELNSFISWKDIGDIFPSYLSLLVSFREENFVLDTNLKLLYYYLRWKSLVKRIKVDNLITYCDFGIQSVARNIFFEKQNCRTYYYMDSANLACFVVNENSNIKYRHHCFGFLYYDCFVSWNDKVSQYFEDSHCNFKNYVNLGCFWSEHIRLIQEEKINSDFKNRLCEQGYREEMKLVSVFDSTFHDDSITTYEDGIHFLEGILKLLQDLPDVFVVLKEKKPRDYHQKITNKFTQILEIYNKLENHPKCFCFKSWENSSEIIASSDLTISFPFTSTTFETISARRKAIWYDAADKFRNTYYDDMPGLVCHNYRELLNRVKNLLWEISNEDYNDYLDKYIKGKIESYLDGKAISRFQKLLINSGSIVSSDIDYSGIDRD